MPIQRTIKNVVHNYTYAEIKVREATSNDPWGPSTSLMSEIAQLTKNPLSYNEVMAMIWRRMNDHGKNWRHVYKSLLLLEYLLKHGSERVAQECRSNIVAVRTLADFQHVDENGRDNGLSVREKARQVALLLGDDERLRSERIGAHEADERFGGGSSSSANRFQPTSTSSPSNVRRQEVSRPPPTNPDVPGSTNEEELQLQLALALSKEEHDEEMKRRKADDLKLQMAIEESKKTARSGSSQKPRRPSSAEASPFAAPAPVKAPSAALLDNLIVDPWASSVNAPPMPVKSSTPHRDPWGDLLDAPAPAPAPVAVQNVPTSSDPWAALRSASPAIPAMTFTDIPRDIAPMVAPWEMVEAKMTVRNGSSMPANAGSAFSKPNNQQMLLGADDEFAALSLRPNTVSMKKSNSGGFDLLDMNLEPAPSQAPSFGAVMQSEATAAKKPEDFLGANAKLVDLSDLVSKPASQNSVNPFAMTNVSKPAAANPFVAKAREEELNRRVPMNQLAGSNSMGQPLQPSTAPSTVYPSLAIVYSPQPVPPQQHGYNPFL